MKLDAMSWPQIEQLDDDVVALLPIAATEQHGLHLPLRVDRRVTEVLAERIEAERADWIALTPTLWVGASDHHLPFPGTLSVPNGVYIELLMALVDSLLNAGFRRIVLLNGHGGNTILMQDALVRTRRRIGSEAKVHLAGCVYWTVAGKRMAEVDGMTTPNVTHACEYETSMMLHLDPDLVQLDRAETRPPALPSAYFDIEGHRPHRVFAAFNMDQYAPCGSMGRPAEATAEKGAKLIDAVVEEVGEFLDEFRRWPFVAGRSRA